MTNAQVKIALLSLVAPAAVIIALSKTASRPPILEQTPVIDTALGFSIQPPAEWFVVTRFDESPSFSNLRVKLDTWQLGVEKAGLRAVFSERPSDSVDDQYHTNITVFAQRLPDDLDISHWNTATSYAQSLLASFSHAFQPSQDVRHVEINGLPAVRTEYQYTQSSMDNQELSVGVVVLISQRRHRLFLLTVTAQTRQFERYRHIFDRVVATFTDSVEVEPT